MSLTINQSGKVKVTSLILFVVVAAAVYYGVAFGGVYWRRYAVSNAVGEQMAYAGQLADETIRAQLVAKIGGMRLPPAAGRVRMVRIPPRTIQVSISYTETVNLLFSKKEIPVSITERRTY